MFDDLYVIDASVAAKWYLDDERSINKARLFLLNFLANRISFHAPVLLQYELGNVLLKAQRKSRRSLDTNAAIKAYRTFCELPIIYHDMNNFERLSALKFAADFNRSFYDSTYITLATSLKCRWLTDEKALGKPLPPGFPTAHILTLDSI